MQKEENLLSPMSDHPVGHQPYESHKFSLLKKNWLSSVTFVPPIEKSICMTPSKITTNPQSLH